MILFYDSETTGIPISGVPSEDPRHPHIVSLSAILDDEQGITRRVMSAIVQPNGFRTEDLPEAFKVHGITTETAEKYGRTLESVMAEFADIMIDADVLSAFNHHFDHKLLKIACARMPNDGHYTGADIREMISRRSAICTMESAANHLIGKKRISLKNAYFEMFKEEIQTGHHGSLEDTMASRRIYYALKAAGALMEPKSLVEKEYATPYVATA